MWGRPAIPQYSCQTPENDQRPARLRRREAISGEPADPKGNSAIGRRFNLEMVKKQIDKALACGQLARVTKEQEEFGETQIVGSFEHLVPGERGFSQAEDAFRERRIIAHSEKWHAPCV
jgi:hypothetical protein